MQWLIKSKFQYSELQAKLKLDLKTIKTNLASFMQIALARFRKVVAKCSEYKLLNCKEDKE